MKTGTIIAVASVFVVLAILGIMMGYPQYKVYSQRLDGEAKLAQATATKKILITQAEAEKDAATQRAAAISIVGRAAKEYPEYRQQEFIGAFADALHEGKINQIMYVPTEANIPITEAGHRTAHKE